MTLASLRSLATSSCTSATLPPPLRLGGSDDLERREARRHVDAERGGRGRLQRLLLRLHDVRQRRVARLVQAQVGRDDGRQLHLQRLETAVDLALDRGAAVGDVHLRRERRLRPVEQRGEHLAGLVGVVVDRLLAQDHELRLFLRRDRLQQLGHGERLQLDVGLDQDRAVGAQRQRRAQRFLARGHAAGHRDDLGGDALLLQPHRLLDRDLVERIHRHLDVGRVDAGAVGLDADLDVVIDDALDRDQDLHGVGLRRSGERAIITSLAPSTATI